MGVARPASTPSDSHLRGVRCRSACGQVPGTQAGQPGSFPDSRSEVISNKIQLSIRRETVTPTIRQPFSTCHVCFSCPWLWASERRPRGPRRRCLKEQVRAASTPEHAARCQNRRQTCPYGYRLERLFLRGQPVSSALSLSFNTPGLSGKYPATCCGIAGFYGWVFSAQPSG